MRPTVTAIIFVSKRCSRNRRTTVSNKPQGKQRRKDQYEDFVSDIYTIIRDGWGDSTPEIKLQVIAEEVQNPLTAIRGYIQLMQRIDFTAIQGLPDNFEGWIEHLDQNINHVWDVLDALLNRKERSPSSED